MIFKKGMSISCSINEQDIKDAKIQIENGIVYICQNFVEGNECVDKLGYFLSWCIGNEGDWIEGFDSVYDIKVKFLTQSQKLNFKNDKSNS